MTAPELIEIETGAPARAVFTTRRGGVSEGPFAGLNLGSDRDDADGAVRRNRRLLCEALGLDAQGVSLGRQVHGTQVRVLDGPSRPGLFTGALRGWPEGDGLATRAPASAWWCWGRTVCPCCSGAGTSPPSPRPTRAGVGW